MADIFISYSSEDKTRVKTIAEALEQKGWSVWWDRQIPVGQRYDTVIEQQLTQAKCVIVIWTQRSVQSEWVKNEASDAAQRNILAPVLLEEVTIPLAFRRIEAARLINWTGEKDHPELAILFNAVASIIDGKPLEGLEPLNEGKIQTVTQYTEKKKRKYLLLTGFCCLAAGLLLYDYFRVLEQSGFNKKGSLLFYLLIIFISTSVAFALYGTLYLVHISKGILPGNTLRLAPPALGISLAILGVLFLPSQPQARWVRIKGQIKTAAEIPIKGAEVNADGTRFYATSITDGTYNLLLENYGIGDEVTLTTSNKDFEDKTISVTIDRRQMRIDFVLNPVSR